MIRSHPMFKSMGFPTHIRKDKLTLYMSSEKASNVSREELIKQQAELLGKTPEEPEETQEAEKWEDIENE